MKWIMFIVMLLIVSSSVSAMYWRTEILEERRTYKIGWATTRRISCKSYSMGEWIHCKERYWAFTPWPGDIVVGDVATYVLTKEQRLSRNISRRDSRILHRIINISEDGCITFKGDAVNMDDPFCIREEQIRSVVYWHEPEQSNMNPESNLNVQVWHPDNLTYRYRPKEVISTGNGSVHIKF